MTLLHVGGLENSGDTHESLNNKAGVLSLDLCVYLYTQTNPQISAIIFSQHL